MEEFVTGTEMGVETVKMIGKNGFNMQTIAAAAVGVTTVAGLTYLGFRWNKGRKANKVVDAKVVKPEVVEAKVTEENTEVIVQSAEEVKTAEVGSQPVDVEAIFNKKMDVINHKMEVLIDGVNMLKTMNSVLQAENEVLKEQASKTVKAKAAKGVTLAVAPKVAVAKTEAPKVEV